MIEPYPELEFRDGFKVVLPHVAALLASVECWKYTYAEAVALANDQLLRNRLNTYQRDATVDHFKRFR